MDQIEYGNWKPASGPAASLDELAKATWEDGVHASNLNASGVNLTEALDEVNDRIKKATGADLFHPYRPFGATPAPYDTTPFGLPDADSLHPTVTMPKWKAAVRDLAVKFPDALPWSDIESEPERKAWERMKAAREAVNEVSERRGLIESKDIPVLGSIPGVKQTLGAAAAFGANAVRDPGAAWVQLSRSLAAQMTSPMDAAANLAGFGLPGAAARSLLKNAAFNGLTNAAIQAPMSAYKQGDYQKAGLPYGLDVWLEEVGGAFGTGFALDAGVRGPSRAIISKFGRDVSPDLPFSRNTERGGLVFDAIEKPELPAPREPSVAVTRETIDAAANNDLKATREILEKTGALRDPEIRSVLERVERGEALDAEARAALEQMGVDAGVGIRAVHEAIVRGSAPVELPPPIRPADAPLMREDGARLLAEVSEAMQAMPARLAEVVQDGLAAGVPVIVRAVQEAVGGPPERLAAAMMELPERALAEAQLHSGRATPVELAATMRQFPDLLDSNVSLETDRMNYAWSMSRMDDAAFEAVARGAVPAPVAALVADMVPREHHARMVADLEKAAPGSLDEARMLIDDLMPMPRQDGPTLDGGGLRIDDVQGPEAKAQVEALRQEAGAAYEEAMAPITRRDELDSQVEKIKGEIAKLEGLSSDKSRQLATNADPKQLDANTVELAKKRAELDAAERELAQIQAELNPTPDGEALFRLAMRSLDMRRQDDVLRAINDALAFGERILPEGVKVEVKPDEQMKVTSAAGTRVQRDGMSNQTTGDIELAMGAVDPAATIGHEAVHTLVTKGLISPDEVAALAALAREAGTFANEAQYRDAYKARADFARVIEEEAAASYIEARVKGTAEGPANTTIERIKQFMERLRQLLSGYGFKSREDIVNAILSGEAAQRQARADWARNAVADGKAAMKAQAEQGATLPDGTQVNGVHLFAIRAYHGSPHDFDRFSLDKIGTGEGAQAYGHGLYFAENEGVARSYKNALGGQRFKDGSTFDDANPAHQAAAYVSGAKSKDEAIASINEDIAMSRRQMDEKHAQILLRARGMMERGAAIPTLDPGRMYEVNIKAEPDDFLDWDKPLSQQSEKVKQALASTPWGEPYIKSNALTGGQVVPRTKEGTKELLDAGIPGIRYLDQGSRIGGEGSRNYVVFDDSMIEIVAKDGQPVKALDDGKLSAIRDDMDMSPEARKARAEAMGFDTSKVWYHGTKSEFDAFDADESAFGMGHWFADTRNYAEWMAGKSGTTIESYIRMKNPYEFDIMKEAENILPMLGDDVQPPTSSREAMQLIAGAMPWDEVARDIAMEARAKGHDAVIFKNFEDRPENMAGGNKQAVLVFDPSNIRSVNAEFDPAKSDSANLLSSIRDAEPEPSLKTDMAFVDRLSNMSKLVEACRG